ncbi:hypothetical protein F5050DRAFT_1709810 [Lentinula boryana]|uniref:HAUS augmin-like complex subunit 3 N-terminal domain-containing protein n=1 Tax=Lentinula boryana TaxID=40481 RepID=A0ABQ8QLS3_9AGAR|nr:hypothetical protein F5050DRAFT_1709810 [Lentinula boryana]
MALSDVEKLCNIVSCLGGPKYTPNELEWATQFAPGKALIEWIAAQLPLEGRNLDDEYSQRAVLSKIALEDEELQLLQNSNPRTNSDLNIDLSHYIPPSRQSNRMTLVDNNAYAFEQEVILLQHRLQQTQKLSQQIQDTAQAITVELNRAASSTIEKQEALESLSLKVDTAVFGTFSKSFDLLKRWQDNFDLDATRDYLANCLNVRKQITQDVTAQLTTIEAWKDQQLPSAAHLKLEALRLQRVLGLDTAGHSSLLSSAEESAYCQQLELLVNSLEEVDGDEGEIYDVLQRLTIENDELDPEPLNIVRELEQAWNMDQLTILEARISVLDKASTQFQQSILPPLQTVHAFLAEQQSVMPETLAILGIFGQELDSIVHQVDAAKSELKASNSSQELTSLHRDSTLENDLKTLLKDLQNLRPSDMPPLVLLDQNDVLSELRAFKAKEKLLNDQEERWCSALPTTLNSLMAMHDPALDITYAHSAMNTSAPFQYSPSVTALELDAKGKGDALTAEVQRLQNVRSEDPGR